MYSADHSPYGVAEALSEAKEHSDDPSDAGIVPGEKEKARKTLLSLVGVFPS